MTYQPKTYRAVGGDQFVVAEGGTMTIQAGGSMTVSAKELTATAAISAGVPTVELSHASVIIAATIADAANHAGIFAVKNTSASGTAAHKITLASGTWDGTNTIVTMNAPGEGLIVHFDSAGDGVIILNSGSAALS